jgi:hypothetical protein
LRDRAAVGQSLSVNELRWTGQNRQVPSSQAQMDGRLMSGSPVSVRASFR